MPCDREFNSQSTGGLRQFLDHLSVLEQKGITTEGQAADQDAVTIMSIHKSKGLEFPVVFLCGLARAFNRDSAREQVLCDKDLGLGLSCVDLENRVQYPSIAKKAISAKIIAQGQSEEMRVLYVAMTRAKDRLIMTYASRYLENEVSAVAGLIDLCDPLLLTMSADCPGKWILLSALRRQEAGELRSLINTTIATVPSASPWLIRVYKDSIEAEDVIVEEEYKEETAIPENVLDMIRSGLSYEYPHLAATNAPSKQTATQLKGREKDLEIKENTAQKVQKNQWRKPSFVEKMSKII